MKLLKNNKHFTIVKNIGSNSFGVGVTLFNQILMVPIFLSYWGVDKYGDWIILTAISSFFTMTDVGINSVTSNEYSILYSKGREAECNSLLINNYVILTALSLFFIIATIVYLYFGDVNSDFNIHTTHEHVTKIILLILVVKVFLTMFSTVLNTVYRAVSLFSKSIFIDNLGRIFETIFLFIGIVFDFNLIIIVCIMTVPCIILLIYKSYNTKKYVNYKLSIVNLDFPLLKKTILPSLGFLSFPISNAVLSQGVSLVLNIFLGAGALVLFNTTRTLVNFIKQVTNIVSTAVWPEFSIAFGRNDYKSMQNLHSFSVGTSFIISFIFSIFILLSGKFIFEIWTGGKIAFNSGLMFSFILVLIVNNFWNTSSMCLMATNKHTKLGVLYLSLSFFSIIILYLLMKSYPQIELIPLCVLIVDVILVNFVFKRVLVLTDDSYAEFFVRIFKIFKINKFLSNFSNVEK